MTPTHYLVPARTASAEIVEKRSRFLCTIARVEDEVAARAVIDELRSRHHDARHTCSAFVLGPDGRLQRSNDDGEPAGTAGAPMLEMLRGAQITEGAQISEGAQLSDVVAVVTRWFGGTLLGAGGLVRAYGEAVRAGLDAAGTCERHLVRELTVDLGHDEAGRVEGDLRARGIAVLDAIYGVQVTLRLGVDPGQEARLAALVAQSTGGRGHLEAAGERWIDVLS